jgi:HSP20 family protein
MREQTNVPVRLYQTDDRLMLVAPMPGLEPENIAITIDGTRVVIHGDERGPHQHDRDLLLEEWTIGPYDREVELPQAVDGKITNATYDNGVLVLAMPKAQAGQGSRAEIKLNARESTRGQRVGHVGRDVQPTSGDPRQAKRAS